MCYNLDVQCFISEHLFYYPGMGEAMSTKKIDIVIPWFNEFKCVDLIYDVLKKLFESELSGYYWSVLLKIIQEA